MTNELGKKIRLSRILNPITKKSVVVALDHALSMGPISGLTEPMETFQKVIDGGADAVLMPPGQARVCLPGFLGKGAPSLIFRLDWTNLFRGILQPTTGYEAPVASVEDAVRYGADAVIAYLFVGYEKDEAEVRNLQNVAKIARECERYNIPFLAEPMARGKRVSKDQYNPEYVKLHVRMAAEVGADFIKTDYTGDPDTFREVVKGCPIPILIAGGPKTKTLRDALEMAKGAMDAGACGVVFGRNVFQAPDPTAMVKALCLVIHERAEVEDALKVLKEKKVSQSVAYPIWELYR